MAARLSTSILCLLVMIGSIVAPASGLGLPPNPVGLVVDTAVNALSLVTYKTSIEDVPQDSVQVPLGTAARISSVGSDVTGRDTTVLLIGNFANVEVPKLPEAVRTPVQELLKSNMGLDPSPFVTTKAPTVRTFQFQATVDRATEASSIPVAEVAKFTAEVPLNATETLVISLVTNGHERVAGTHTPKIGITGTVVQTSAGLFFQGNFTHKPTMTGDHVFGAEVTLDDQATSLLTSVPATGTSDLIGITITYQHSGERKPLASELTVGWKAATDRNTHISSQAAGVPIEVLAEPLPRDTAVSISTHREEFSNGFDEDLGIIVHSSKPHDATVLINGTEFVGHISNLPSAWELHKGFTAVREYNPSTWVRTWTNATRFTYQTIPNPLSSVPDPKPSLELTIEQVNDCKAKVENLVEVEEVGQGLLSFETFETTYPWAEIPDESEFNRKWEDFCRSEPQETLEDFMTPKNQTRRSWQASMAATDGAPAFVKSARLLLDRSIPVNSTLDIRATKLGQIQFGIDESSNELRLGALRTDSGHLELNWTAPDNKTRPLIDVGAEIDLPSGENLINLDLYMPQTTKDKAHHSRARAALHVVKEDQDPDAISDASVVIRNLPPDEGGPCVFEEMESDATVKPPITISVNRLLDLAADIHTWCDRWVHGPVDVTLPIADDQARDATLERVEDLNRTEIRLGVRFDQTLGGGFAVNGIDNITLLESKKIGAVGLALNLTSSLGGNDTITYQDGSKEVVPFKGGDIWGAGNFSFQPLFSGNDGCGRDYPCDETPVAGTDWILKYHKVGPLEPGSESDLITDILLAQERQDMHHPAYPDGEIVKSFHLLEVNLLVPEDGVAEYFACGDDDDGCPHNNPPLFGYAGSHPGACFVHRVDRHPNYLANQLGDDVLDVDITLDVCQIDSEAGRGVSHTPRTQRSTPTPVASPRSYADSEIAAHMAEQAEAYYGQLKADVCWHKEYREWHAARLGEPNPTAGTPCIVDPCLGDPVLATLNATLEERILACHAPPCTPPTEPLAIPYTNFSAEVPVLDGYPPESCVPAPCGVILGDVPPVEPTCLPPACQETDGALGCQDGPECKECPPVPVVPQSPHPEPTISEVQHVRVDVRPQPVYGPVIRNGEPEPQLLLRVDPGEMGGELAEVDVPVALLKRFPDEAIRGVNSTFDVYVTVQGDNPTIHDRIQLVMFSPVVLVFSEIHGPTVVQHVPTYIAEQRPETLSKEGSAALFKDVPARLFADYQVCYRGQLFPLNLLVFGVMQQGATEDVEDVKYRCGTPNTPETCTDPQECFCDDSDSDGDCDGCDPGAEGDCCDEEESGSDCCEDDSDGCCDGADPSSPCVDHCNPTNLPGIVISECACEYVTSPLPTCDPNCPPLDMLPDPASGCPPGCTFTSGEESSPVACETCPSPASPEINTCKEPCEYVQGPDLDGCESHDVCLVTPMVCDLPFDPPGGGGGGGGGVPDACEFEPEPVPEPGEPVPPYGVYVAVARAVINGMRSDVCGAGIPTCDELFPDAPIVCEDQDVCDGLLADLPIVCVPFECETSPLAQLCELPQPGPCDPPTDQTPGVCQPPPDPPEPCEEGQPDPPCGVDPCVPSDNQPAPPPPGCGAQPPNPCDELGTGCPMPVPEDPTNCAYPNIPGLCDLPPPVPPVPGTPPIEPGEGPVPVIPPVPGVPPVPPGIPPGQEEPPATCPPDRAPENCVGEPVEPEGGGEGCLFFPVIGVLCPPPPPMGPPGGEDPEDPGALSEPEESAEGDSSSAMSSESDSVDPDCPAEDMATMFPWVGAYNGTLPIEPTMFDSVTRTAATRTVGHYGGNGHLTMGLHCNTTLVDLPLAWELVGPDQCVCGSHLNLDYVTSYAGATGTTPTGEEYSISMIAYPYFVIKDGPVDDKEASVQALDYMKQARGGCAPVTTPHGLTNVGKGWQWLTDTGLSVDPGYTWGVEVADPTSGALDLTSFTERCLNSIAGESVREEYTDGSTAIAYELDWKRGASNTNDHAQAYYGRVSLPLDGTGTVQIEAHWIVDCVGWYTIQDQYHRFDCESAMDNDLTSPRLIEVKVL